MTPIAALRLEDLEQAVLAAAETTEAETLRLRMGFADWDAFVALIPPPPPGTPRKIDNLHFRFGRVKTCVDSTLGPGEWFVEGAES